MEKELTYDEMYEKVYDATTDKEGYICVNYGPAKSYLSRLKKYRFYVSADESSGLGETFEKAFNDWLNDRRKKRAEKIAQLKKQLRALDAESEAA